MRNFKYLLLMGILPIVGFALLTGCKKNKVDDNKPVAPSVEVDSVIKLDKTLVTAAVSGETCLLGYTIENGDAHPGEKITAKSAEAWVSDFDTSVTGALRFKVAANEGSETREALVTVSYRFAKDVTFTVKQSALTTSGFSVSKVGNGMEYFSYTVDVFPENKQLPYIVMSASPSYIEAGELEEDDALYADDFAYFEYLGSFHGQTALEVMHDRAKMGDQRNITVGSGTPGETYIFYCYHFDYDSGARLSDIYRFEITVDHPTVKDVADTYFTFKYDIQGPRVLAEVTSSTDVDYYFDIMTEEELKFAESKGFTKEEYIKQWWATVVANLHHIDGYSTSDIVSQNTCQGTDSKTGRPRSQWDYDLLASTNYYIFAFNLDENALCVTTPVYQKFTTGKVEPSDNKLTLTVSDVTAYRATINIAATADSYEDAYVSHIATAEEWKKYGKNDNERMNYIKNNIALEYLHGGKTIGYSPLTPGTQYVAYAFGLYGGVVTTQLWTVTFTTKSDKPGEATIEIKDLGYYDAQDLSTVKGLEFFGNESYSGNAIIPIELVVKPKSHGAFFYDIYDWTGRYDEYDDQNYINHLIWMIEVHGSLKTKKTYTIAEFGHRYVAIALVVDDAGLYSPLYKKEYIVEYDGVREASEFAAWWGDGLDSGSGSGPGLQSLVIEPVKAEPATATDIVEVDCSVSRVKPVSSVVKASQRVFDLKVTPEVDAITATR